MSFFNKKESLSKLGLDIGTSAIKLVELNFDHGQPQLVTYGQAKFDYSLLSLDQKKNLSLYSDGLIKLMEASRVTTKRTIASLSATNTFTTVIELPAMPKKEIDSAVRWEAKKIIPLPLEKMSLDWHVINGPDQKMMKIIITAASKDVVNNTLFIYQQAGAKLIGLETEAIALRRSILRDSEETTMLMDIGATNTNIVVFHQGLPAITRNIAIGGRTIDVNIANSMNVNLERAEQFKSNFGPVLPGQPEHPVSKAIQFVIDNIMIREIRPLIMTFEDVHKTEVKKIILTGGTSHLKNLPAYLQKILGKEVIIKDPWAAISCPQELLPELQKIGPEMAVAIGLALK